MMGVAAAAGARPAMQRGIWQPKVAGRLAQREHSPRDPRIIRANASFRFAVYSSPSPQARSSSLLTSVPSGTAVRP